MMVVSAFKCRARDRRAFISLSFLPVDTHIAVYLGRKSLYEPGLSAQRQPIAGSLSSLIAGACCSYVDAAHLVVIGEGAARQDGACTALDGAIVV